MTRWLLLSALLVGACSDDDDSSNGDDTEADTDTDADTDGEIVPLETELVSQGDCHENGPPSITATAAGGGDILVEQVNFRSMSTCATFAVKAELDTIQHRIMVNLKDLNKPCKGECFLDLSYRLLDLAPGSYTVFAPGGEAPVTVE